MSDFFSRYGVIMVVAVIISVVTAIIMLTVGPGSDRPSETACDGPNMVYRDRNGSIAAVAANDPRCTGREGTHS